MSEKLHSLHPVEAFVRAQFNKAEQFRIQKMQSYLIGRSGMDPQTRCAIMIPAYHNEPGLYHTLMQYNNQTTPEYEIIILVNGHHGTKIDESPAYQDSLRFIADNPKSQAVMTHMLHQQGTLKIGILRRELAALALLRAKQSNINLESFILITHDADLERLQPKYLKQLLNRFDSNPQLAALTGFCDYPQDFFERSPYLFLMQRFSDVLEIIHRMKDNHLVFHSANSAYRATEYMNAGGHRRTRIAEGQAVYKELIRNNKVVSYHRKQSIVTNPRRQIAAFLDDTRQAARYEHFGTEHEFKELYNPNLSWYDLLHNTKDCTETMRLMLASEIDAVWCQKIIALYRMHDRNSQDISVQNMIDKVKELYPERTQTLSHYIFRAAKIVGIDIEFSKSSRVIVTSINRAISQIIK